MTRRRRSFNKFGSGRWTRESVRREYLRTLPPLVPSAQPREEYLHIFRQLEEEGGVPSWVVAESDYSGRSRYGGTFGGNQRTLKAAEAIFEKVLKRERS